MASRLNIGVTAYGNIERSDVKRLPVERVFEIASILNVHYTEIFGDLDKLLANPEEKLRMDAAILGLMEYFSRDKQLLCEMLKTFKEIYERIEQMLQDHMKTMIRMMKMQQEIHQSLLATKK
jgi:transcriptional regulator with XRE-family HTH domain